MGQPDLVAGADFGRNGGEFHRQVLDQALAHRSLEFGRKLGAADQAGAVQADIEIGEDISRLQAARPFLHRVEMSGGIGAADHGADRRSHHDIGNDAVGHQRPDDADMGKAACGAAAQRQPDHRPADTAQPHLVAAVGAILAAAHPAIQHQYSPAAFRIFAAARPRQNCLVPFRMHGLCPARSGLGRDYDWATTAGSTVGCSPGSWRPPRICHPRLEFAAFSVKSMAMTSRGNGFGEHGRAGWSFPALALAVALVSLLPASASAQMFQDRPPPVPPARFRMLRADLRLIWRRPPGRARSRRFPRR